MSLLLDQASIRRWTKHGHRREDVAKLFEERGPDAHLVHFSWDGGKGLNFRAITGLYEPYLYCIIEFTKASLEAHPPSKAGDFLICLHDAIWRPISESVPVFGFSKKKWDEFSILIPDTHFISNKGQVEYLAAIRQMNEIVPWEARKMTAFWRGRSTGGGIEKGRWRENRRVRLAMLAREVAEKELLDCEISEVIQFDDESTKQQIVAEEIVGPEVAYLDFSAFRYQIDIDGNASAWSLFWKLAMESVVLKVESDEMQWYYPNIKSGTHYLEVKRDLSNLVEVVRWARAHDEECRGISRTAQEFVKTQTFENLKQEFAAAIDVVLRSQTP